MAQDLAEMELNKLVPYTLHLDDGLLSTTKQKLHLARCPEAQIDIAETNWSQGSEVSVVRRLAEYWKDEYDGRAEEARAPTNPHSLLTSQTYTYPLLNR